ncbi:MAG: hypothetical protein M1521_08385 [Thermotogae bacterium]|nr:hypothetical protein [Thermotogota bacterium]
MIIEWLQKRFAENGVNVPSDRIKEFLEYPTDSHVWSSSGHLNQLCFDGGKITYKNVDKSNGNNDLIVVLDNLYETINDIVEALEIQRGELNG